MELEILFGLLAFLLGLAVGRQFFPRTKTVYIESLEWWQSGEDPPEYF